MIYTHFIDEDTGAQRGHEAAKCQIQNLNLGTSLAVQWLRLRLPMQGGAGSIPHRS